jgi:hypothetical protein
MRVPGSHGVFAEWDYGISRFRVVNSRGSDDWDRVALDRAERIRIGVLRAELFYRDEMIDLMVSD